MDTTTLMLSVAFGSLGLGYFVYGKKQERFVALVAGVVLIALPYFSSNSWLTLGLGSLVMILPFLFRI